MVEAKEFWSYLCEELDYRFFAGVVCEGLKPLYNTMSKDFMHYVPAVNERVALGLVNGARLAGFKGALLMQGDGLLDIMNLLLSFNKEYKVPTLVICYDKEYYWSKHIVPLLLAHFKVMHIEDDVCEPDYTFRHNIDIVTKKAEKENRPGILFIGEGSLK